MAEEPDGYVVARLLDALAHDDRTSALDVDVALAGRQLLVTGTATSAAHRASIDLVARELFPELEVRTEMDVALAPHGGPAARTGLLRVAAVGDVHVGLDGAGTLAPHLGGVAAQADLLLLAGDLTRHGDPAEARVLAAELRDVGVPVVAVLGNHDLHSDRGDGVADALRAVGATVLEGEATVLELDGRRVGVAGTKGFGGGFPGAMASDFGEPEMKAFVRHTRSLADRLQAALEALDVDVRIALLHYAPVEATLHGERLEIYPFLGSYLLAEAVDRAGADLVLHGHAHRGSERGVTPGGVPVRNVAQPVIGDCFRVYCLGESADGAGCELLPPR